jgi:hypothetical protein
MHTKGNKNAPRPCGYDFFDALEVIFPEREAFCVDDHKFEMLRLTWSIGERLRAR